jgi:transcriptional regulator with XRE-family HTH domain
MLFLLLFNISDKIFIKYFKERIYMYLKRLKELREDSDIKQSTIAKLLNITRQQYSLYETGKRTIPVNHLKTLAIFYNISSDYILEITDEITPYKKISK